MASPQRIRNGCRTRLAATALAAALLACDGGRPAPAFDLDDRSWEIAFEIRFPEPAASRATIQAVGRGSIGSASCVSTEQDSRIERCVWLIHDASDRLRYVVVERAPGRTEVYDPSIGFGDGASGWTEWQPPAFVATSTGVHFDLLRGRPPARDPDGLPADATKMRFRGRPWPPAPDDGRSNADGS